MLCGIEIAYVLRQLAAQKRTGVRARYPHETQCRQVHEHIASHRVCQFLRRIAEARVIAIERRALGQQKFTPVLLHSPLLKICGKA